MSILAVKQTNRYYKCAKISERKLRRIIHYFALDLTAYQTAELIGMTHKSVNEVFLKLRHRIFEESENSSYLSDCIKTNEIAYRTNKENIESQSQTKNKITMFGIYRRQNLILTDFIYETDKLFQLIDGQQFTAESISDSESWQKYDGVVDVVKLKYLRVFNKQKLKGQTKPNGSESFWSFTKRRLQRFNGVPEHTFYLHLKECEFRYNHRQQDINQILLKLCEKSPI